MRSLVFRKSEHEDEEEEEEEEEEGRERVLVQLAGGKSANIQQLINEIKESLNEQRGQRGQRGLGLGWFKVSLP